MRKILCIVLVFVIFSFNLSFVVLAEENNTSNTANNTTNTKTDDLQNEQKELQEQISEASEQLEDVQNELSENLQQVQKLDEKIQTSQSEIDELNIKITKLQNSIDEVETKLQNATEKYERQQKILDERLVAMYETSDTQYLDVILSSKNVSEFLSNYFLITELATYDTELLENMKTQKDEIELEKKKLDNSKEQLATIKENQTKTARIIENTKIVRENFISKLSDQEKGIQSKIDEYNTRFAAINSEILTTALSGLDSKYIGGELAWPVPGYTRITSKYGMRTHPITGVYKLHTGVDISAPMGANFVAANDGIVVKAQYNSAYGNMVVIDHGGGVSTLYAHGSEIPVQVGQTVKRGETIVLKVGSTGYSTGAHAHFEVRLNGIVTDPMPYITNHLIPDSQNDDE